MTTMIKMNSNCLIYLILFTTFVLNIECSSIVESTDSIWDPQYDLIKQMPGYFGPISFRQFSGYLKGHESNATKKNYIHYLLAESQSSDPSKDPLILWVQGGPGCSSLVGYFCSNGPFSVPTKSSDLASNPRSWNSVANVLYLDSPSNVGYSYSLNSNDTFANDQSTTDATYLALKDFFVKFPQFSHNEFYLMGQGYAAVQLTLLGLKLDQDKSFNFKGIAIGNGDVDRQMLSNSLIPFVYYHGLIGSTLANRLSIDCCQGKSITDDSCDFYSVNMSMTCSDHVRTINDKIHNGQLNVFNLYDPLRVDPLDIGSPLTGIKCYGFGTLFSRYLNRVDVRRALHIPNELDRWTMCSNGLVYEKQYANIRENVNQLIKSNRKLRLLFYAGDLDLTCNFLGIEKFVDQIASDNQLKLNSDYHWWKFDNQIVGYVKHYDGILFMTIKGGGYMISSERPTLALEFIKRFIGNVH